MTDLDPSSPDDLWAISDCLDAIVANPASVHGYSLSRLRDAAVDIRSEADYHAKKHDGRPLTRTATMRHLAPVRAPNRKEADEKSTT